jgi:class 3 adenylate cyclase
MDIADLLRSVGLERYQPAFRAQEIDIDDLPELTETDLEKLGLPLGPRRRLLKAVAALRQAPPSAPAIAVMAATSSTAPISSSAERRQLTIMFVDLVGSTALSAQLDPEDMREIIGTYHRCCAEQITKAGGFVAKYMGDGVLAYFGYPQAHEDDAERAIRGALSLVEAIPKLQAGYCGSLQVRIGIATGLVVVGDLIGEGAAQEQGVVGETPNVSSRLQALAEPGQVIISDSTRRLTGGLFEYRDLGGVMLKGLANPVQAWQVLGASTVESRFEAHHGTAFTPLVGREEELALLSRRWQQAKAGKGSVVLISGEPGIGKSRIVQALLEGLQAEPMHPFAPVLLTSSAGHRALRRLHSSGGRRVFAAMTPTSNGSISWKRCSAKQRRTSAKPSLCSRDCYQCGRTSAIEPSTLRRRNARRKRSAFWWRKSNGWQRNRRW